VDRALSKAANKTVRIAGSYVVTTCATMAALLLLLARSALRAQAAPRRRSEANGANK